MGMTHRTTPEASRLLLAGQKVMSEIEANGVRVDVDRLDETVERTTADIAALEAGLKKHEVYREWQKAYGPSLNFQARDQLAHVLFDRMGYATGGATTKGRRASTQKGVLELIDDPFVRDYLKIEPMKKALATNLGGIRRELVRHADGDWYVHPNNNLNTTVTFRPSSDNPNWKNFPKRNPEQAKLVGPVFVPRRGRRFVNIDQAQIEVRVPACDELTADPELIRYILDPKSDMHRDQAVKVWKTNPTAVTKAVRQTTKTNFVFATLYGSPWYNTAKKLWDDIDRYNLRTAAESGFDSTPMKEHLKHMGISGLGACDKDAEPEAGTFAAHVRDCERGLWGQFSVYKTWRQKQVERYHREGGLTMVTGFAVNGSHSRTQIPNYKIQGPAYHITLWSLVRLMEEEFRRYKMKTLVLGEIYDSAQFDAPDDEVQDLLDLCTKVMTVDVRKHWPWITVPLAIECEVSPVDGSWYECAQWVDDGRSWKPKGTK